MKEFESIISDVKAGYENILSKKFTPDSFTLEEARYNYDFKPKGGNENILALMVGVIGLPAHTPITLAHDGRYNKQSADKNYQISLKLPRERIEANNSVDIVFSIHHAPGNPVMDLLYLTLDGCRRA